MATEDEPVDSRNSSDGKASHRLSLHVERLAPGVEHELPEGHSVLYVRAGTVTTFNAASEPVVRQANEAWRSRPPARLMSGAVTSWLDRWTLSPWRRPASVARGNDRAAASLGQAVATSVRVQQLSAKSALMTKDVDFGQAKSCLLRCDRVDFPPGGEAYLHVHAGPGIRRLIAGSLRVDTNGASNEYGPGDFWFEEGPSPVYAAASIEHGASFVRVLVLPVSYQGRSSITYLREEDQLKPKHQRYSIFVDEVITLQ